MRITRRILSAALAVLAPLGAPLAAQQLCKGALHDAPVLGYPVVTGAQSLYTAGFAKGPPATANRVAKLDAAGWTVLPGSFDKAIHALAETTQGLLAGGLFNALGGQTVNHVALFDGAAWHALGSGIDGSTSDVRAVVEYGGNTYVAGTFSAAGGVACANIARFDGSAWQPLTSGITGTVEALDVYGGQLIVAGTFTSAGGLPLANIAAWDGAQWSSIGGGSLPAVHDLAVANNRLYAAANEVYLDAGANWQQVGTIVANTSVQARAITLRNGVIYAGGPWVTFCLAGNDGPCLGIARYAGGAWTLSSHDEDAPVLAKLSLATFDDGVYQTGGTAGLEKVASTPVLYWISAAQSAWFTGAQIVLHGGCYDASQTAIVHVGSAALPATVIDAHTISAALPAGATGSTGWLDLVLEHGGTNTVWPKAIEIRPSLTGSIGIVPFLNLVSAGFSVASGTGSGSAWLYWSPAPAAANIPIPGVFGPLMLNPAGMGQLGTLSLGVWSNLTLSFVPGSIPSGTAIAVQAGVLEQAAGVFQAALTNAVTVVVP